MRVHFTEQMNLLSAELTRMGGLCEKVNQDRKSVV